MIGMDLFSFTSLLLFPHFHFFSTFTFSPLLLFLHFYFFPTFTFSPLLLFLCLGLSLFCSSLLFLLFPFPHNIFIVFPCLSYLIPPFSTISYIFSFSLFLYLLSRVFIIVAHSFFLPISSPFNLSLSFLPSFKLKVLIFSSSPTKYMYETEQIKKILHETEFELS